MWWECNESMNYSNLSTELKGLTREWGVQVMSFDAFIEPHMRYSGRRVELVDVQRMSAKYAAPPKFVKLSQCLA